ncbi:MAG TPA: serine/threonine-protein kinase, partial [Gemmatimonadales bacterium]|nr:serine/threonine-protein kinase [Gemmatimonadales bacterium]
MTLRSSAPTTDLVGQVIADRYHVVKKLGEGGMGQVYLAEHVKMGRRSAIKVMNQSMIHDPDAVARFNREAANASRITHPNVCAVYDFGETPDGVIYLAMEFIEGEPLTDLIQREGALKIHRAFNIFRQVADALTAAHDLGIVHRDLKPDNIMLAKGRDGGDIVKVVDFGIAKAMGGDDAGQKVTKTGLVVGTPEFMSPE